MTKELTNEQIKIVLNQIYCEDNATNVFFEGNDEIESFQGIVDSFSLDTNGSIYATLLDQEDNCFDIDIKELTFDDIGANYLVLQKSNTFGVRVYTYGNTYERLEDRLIDCVSATISNFDEYDSCDIQSIKDQGFENYGDGVIFLQDNFVKIDNL